MKGGDRIDDTPVHKAVREALANCLVNTDFFGKYGVIIKKEPDCLILENPGYIRVGKKQMIHGGKSDPRNKALMKMFNLINIGERAGSGVPNIFQTWDHENWIEPVIEESFGPDRTVLTLSFVDKTTQAPPKHHPSATQTTRSNTDQFSSASSQSVYSLTELQLQILSELKKNPSISQTALAKLIGRNINTVKYHIKKMRDWGIIKREGSSQKGSWIVKI